MASGLVTMPNAGDGHFGAPVGVKILGMGDLNQALTVKANAFSAGARAKIEAAGGTAEVI